MQLKCLTKCLTKYQTSLHLFLSCCKLPFGKRLNETLFLNYSVFLKNLQPLTVVCYFPGCMFRFQSIRCHYSNFLWQLQVIHLICICTLPPSLPSSLPSSTFLLQCHEWLRDLGFRPTFQGNVKQERI